jgi:hypothetical protein
MQAFPKKKGNWRLMLLFQLYLINLVNLNNLNKKYNDNK